MLLVGTRSTGWSKKKSVQLLDSEPAATEADYLILVRKVMCVHVAVETERYSTRADTVYFDRTVVGFYYRRYFFGGGGFLHTTTMGRGMYKPFVLHRVLLVPTRSTGWSKKKSVGLLLNPAVVARARVALARQVRVGCIGVATNDTTGLANQV